jgi:hypothetical protein
VLLFGLQQKATREEYIVGKRSTLREVRERMRPDVKEALELALVQLQALDIRRQELMEEIDWARAILDDGEVGDRPSLKGRTLREAMEIVLGEKGPMPVRKLAEEIGRRGLYTRQDGLAADAHQVHAYIYNYPDTFERVDRGTVGLRPKR